MNKKEKATRDRIFSWNDQSPNIRTVTWESRKKLNIKMYEKKWKAVQSMVTRNRTKKTPRYARKLSYSLDINNDPENSIDKEENEKKRKIARELVLAKFKKLVKQIIFLRSVATNVLKYAMEKGAHEKITSDPRLRLKVHDNDFCPDGTTLTFDPKQFKSDYQGYFPKWAKEITSKVPGDRTDDDIDSLYKILKQLKEFRRYTPEIQRLLCKVARYDRFGRQRVIIRKGHVGSRFYIIYSGTVAFTLSDDDCEVFSKPREYYNLGKGDAFGELALIRNVTRSATIVCLKTTEFLYIEKEDFTEIGIDDILRRDMEIRVEFLRQYDLFSTWPQQVLQKLAEESRSMEYRNDLVINNNLLQTEMLYVVIKGRCQVLRLLDLTKSKKWMKLRRNQKKRCNYEFPEVKSTPYSCYGAQSRLSGISTMMTAGNDDRIPRTFSQHAPPKTVHVQPRLVKSAECCTATQTRENPIKKMKRASYPCSAQESCDRSAASKTESDQNKVGVGVFLSLDVIEKGQSAGLRRVLETDGGLAMNNIDRRHLFLVSKGCFIISIPVESVRKHADFKTIKKIQKRAKNYPNDEALVDRYLDETRWNVYKEVLMGRMIKDIERRKDKIKPGSMYPVTKQTQTNSINISRPETQQTMYVRPQSILSQRLSTPRRRQVRLSGSARSSLPNTPQPIPELDGGYPYTTTETIYAQGSRRNLLLLNGRIRANTIQEELEEQLLNSCVQVY